MATQNSAVRTQVYGGGHLLLRRAAAVLAAGFYEAHEAAIASTEHRVKSATGDADELGRMIIYPPPKSNAQRQREFQRRHPGYDARRKANERAQAKRESERVLMAERMRALEAARAAEAPVPVNITIDKPVLILPVQAKDPVMGVIGAGD